MQRPIQSDSRYTVAREFCGHDKPRFVARWCGDFIASRSDYPAAVLCCVTHKAARNGYPVIIEQLPAPRGA